MKKKRTYIVILALCAVAGLFFLNSSRTEQKYYETDSSQIFSIEVEDRINRVEVVPSEDENIKVTYYDKSSSGYDISVVNDILIISNQSSAASDDVSAGIRISDTPLIIAVPANYSGTFTAATFDACIVDESLCFSDVDIVSLSEILD